MAYRTISIDGEVLTVEKIRAWREAAGRIDGLRRHRAVRDERAAVAAIEQEFASDVEVDTRSALIHLDTITALAARGVRQPTAEQYQGELEVQLVALGWEATQVELTPATAGGPSQYQIVPVDDAQVHALALQILRAARVTDGELYVTQAGYDEAVRQARLQIAAGGKALTS
jgi:hypothetical protein